MKKPRNIITVTNTRDAPKSGNANELLSANEIAPEMRVNAARYVSVTTHPGISEM